jgi:hypothetical protein
LRFVPNRVRTPELLRPVLLTSAALMIVAGIGIALILGETTIGLVIAAVGVFDLLTMKVVLGAVTGRKPVPGAPQAAPEPGAAEPPPAQPDPSYNPYARED